MNVLSLVEHFVVDLLHSSPALFVCEAAGGSAPVFTVYQVSRLAKYNVKNNSTFPSTRTASHRWFFLYLGLENAPQSTHTHLSDPQGRAGIPKFCRQFPLALLPLNLLAPCASVRRGRRAALSPLVRTAQRPACLSRGISSSLAQFRISSNPSSQ